MIRGAPELPNTKAFFFPIPSFTHWKFNSVNHLSISKLFLGAGTTAHLASTPPAIAGISYRDQFVSQLLHIQSSSWLMAWESPEDGLQSLHPVENPEAPDSLHWISSAWPLQPVGESTSRHIPLALLHKSVFQIKIIFKKTFSFASDIP